ncbi:hypothetical protein [Mycobacterium canetti]|uniref:hypothetical protein n=1 Tax=Mycobacterium canetti TaxID=78331 RepID=UPI00034CB70F|nr:hypothetical protein [Mycobacterium canetti]
MDFGFPDPLNRSTTADDWWRQVASQLAVPGITRGWATYRACRAMVASTQPWPIFADISAVQPNKDHRGC